jgi:hypothetical protein
MFYFRMKAALSFALMLIVWFSVSTARSEIVERPLGTDAAGNPVYGHVLQGGRDQRRSTRSSGLPDRRPDRSSALRDRGYQSYDSYFFPYWCAPIIPLHCGGPMSIWHGHGWGWGGNSVSVTIIR